MSETTVTTEAQNVQTKIDALKWEIDRHMALEQELAQVCAFLAQAITPDCLSEDLKFDDAARQGLACILTRYQGLLTVAGYEDKNSTFVHPMHPGRCASNPHLAKS